MDTGWWTLNCQNCNATFAVELTAEQQIVEFARSYTCPACNVTPANLPVIPSRRTWHEIVAFTAAKEAPAV